MRNDNDASRRRYRQQKAIEMNTVEPVNLKELEHTDYESLIKFRIRKILMICSHYDAFILEEDGQFLGRHCTAEKQH